jgi:hypothetical protein
MLPDKNYWGTW